MQVRRAVEDDVAALARLHAEVQALHRAALPHRYRDASLGDVEAWVRRLRADPDVVLLVAGEDGDPAVGFAVVRRDASSGDALVLPRLRATVEAIGVASADRRRGVGRALMAAAEELARSWGAASVVLDVQGFNDGAERFYRALGYLPAALRMSKRL
jgi:ribosomal protein S18 acetylase RimI-like enzyme